MPRESFFDGFAEGLSSGIDRSRQRKAQERQFKMQEEYLGMARETHQQQMQEAQEKAREKLRAQILQGGAQEAFNKGGLPSLKNYWKNNDYRVYHELIKTQAELDKSSAEAYKLNAEGGKMTADTLLKMQQFQEGSDKSLAGIGVQLMNTRGRTPEETQEKRAELYKRLYPSVIKPLSAKMPEEYGPQAEALLSAAYAKSMPQTKISEAYEALDTLNPQAEAEVQKMREEIASGIIPEGVALNKRRAALYETLQKQQDANMKILANKAKMNRDKTAAVMKIRAAAEKTNKSFMEISATRAKLTELVQRRRQIGEEILKAEKEGRKYTGKLPGVYDSLIVTMVARIVEKGVLTDKDIDRYLNNESLGGYAGKLLHKYKYGKNLSDRELEALFNSAESMFKGEEGLYNSADSSYRSMLKEQGMTDQQLDKILPVNPYSARPKEKLRVLMQNPDVDPKIKEQLSGAYQQIEKSKVPFKVKQRLATDLIIKRRPAQQVLQILQNYANESR